MACFLAYNKLLLCDKSQTEVPSKERTKAQSNQKFKNTFLKKLAGEKVFQSSEKFRKISRLSLFETVSQKLIAKTTLFIFIKKLFFFLN
jgi:hypothetical protein